MTTRELALRAPIDLRGTLGPLSTGFGDPTWRFARREVLQATRTPEGAATLHLSVREDALRATAFGPGAGWVLDRLPALVGSAQRPPDPSTLPPAIRRLAERGSGVRLARTGRLVEALVPIVLQQLVTGREAARAFTNLVRHASEPAPGDIDGLWLPLDAERLAELPEAVYVGLGVLPRQARTLLEIARRARRIEALESLAPADAAARLESIAGIGPWTSGELRIRALGDGDAVVVGDLHLPGLVVRSLAPEAPADTGEIDDARMLAVLAPFRPYRGWVLRWLLGTATASPRRHPRPALRPLERPQGTGLRPARLR